MGFYFYQHVVALTKCHSFSLLATTLLFYYSLLNKQQQAQTYFAGQSRYVGVYDTSRLAARAYVVVQDYLRQYRENRSFTKETPKEELARIFAAARKAADDAVSELRKEDALTGTAAVDSVAAAAAAVAAVGPTTKI